jgi:tetratricopeptide (TPR) repeat protein
MLFLRLVLSLPLVLLATVASAQRAQPAAPPGLSSGQGGGLPPGLGLLDDKLTPDHLRLYGDCMALARKDPLKALPMAEKWHGEGGGLAARHCVATAMFEAGRYPQAAVQFESIARDMGQDRPGLRAELWAQAGQAYIEAGAAEKAAEAQSRALELKSTDADLWIDRGISYAAMKAWPRAVSDFDRALDFRPNNVEILVLRAAAWRNAGSPSRALDDSARALKIAPDHSDALLEHGYASLALGDRSRADSDFSAVLRMVPPGSSAARRADAGLRGEQPVAPASPPPAPAVTGAPKPAAPTKR